MLRVLAVGLLLSDSHGPNPGRVLPTARTSTPPATARTSGRARWLRSPPGPLVRSGISVLVMGVVEIVCYKEYVMSGFYRKLSHSRWHCKHHGVFGAKRRGKVVFGQLRLHRHLGQ